MASSVLTIQMNVIDTFGVEDESPKNCSKDVGKQDKQLMIRSRVAYLYVRRFNRLITHDNGTVGRVSSCNQYDRDLQFDLQDGRDPSTCSTTSSKEQLYLKIW